jgi:hypothetical protein
MTKTERAAIIALIDSCTEYDAATIRFHQDGTISAMKDANKTFNGHEPGRCLVGYASDFANGADPYHPPLADIGESCA